MPRNSAVAIVCAAAAIALVLLIDCVLGSQVAIRGTVAARHLGIADGWDTFTVTVRAEGIADTLDVPVRYDEYWAAWVGSDVTVCFRRGFLTGHNYNIHVLLGERV